MNFFPSKSLSFLVQIPSHEHIRENNSIQIIIQIEFWGYSYMTFNIKPWIWSCQGRCGLRNFIYHRKWYLISQPAALSQTEVFWKWFSFHSFFFTSLRIFDTLLILRLSCICFHLYLSSKKIFFSIISDELTLFVCWWRLLNLFSWGHKFE